jgi:beta-glucanase (GH16 family)
VAAAALLLAGAFAAVDGTAASAIPPTPAGYSLVFGDDFNGPAYQAIDGNWIQDVGTGYPGGAPNWGTGEVETMTGGTTNVHLDGHGHLGIKPLRDNAGRWTSGRVETSRTNFAAPAGGKLKVDAVIQQPNVSGAAAAGYWPAFWMLGAAARGTGAAGWPGIGEVDILEDVNGLNSVFTTLHCGTSPGGPCNETSGIGSGQKACAGCQTGYHRYTMLYDRSVSPERVAWYLDGKNIFNVYSNQVSATTWNNALHHGFFVILDVAMGGGFPAAFGGGPTAATRSGVPMLVDYVAVWTAA